MEELATKRFPLLQANLAEHLSADRKLFCVHKNVEHLVPAQADLGSTRWPQFIGEQSMAATTTRNSIPPSSSAFHSGIASGALECSLPSRAFKMSGMTTRRGKGTQTSELLQRRHLATSIIQAMGRVRLRKVIDEQGRCAPTDVSSYCPPESAARRYSSTSAKSCRTSRCRIGRLTPLAPRLALSAAGCHTSDW